MKISHYEWDSETDLIARGGFAEVFKAKDLNLEGRFVALKIYRESISQNSSSKSTGQKEYSLQEEFKMVSQLSHTNVITYYGLDYIKHQDHVGRKIQLPVLIMEYATQGTLVDFMEKNYDQIQTLKILKEIIFGLHYLHSEGIIHRDLKPGNILITKNRKGERVAKITDFGISRAIISEDTIEHSMTQGVGTPHYMAPEQIYKSKFGLHGEISERTDYWGIGVLAYWMGKGELPFGNNQKDYELIRDEIVNKEPDWSGLVSPYLEIAKACLIKDANERVAESGLLLDLIDGRDTEKTQTGTTVLDPSGKTRISNPRGNSGKNHDQRTHIISGNKDPEKIKSDPIIKSKKQPVVLGVGVLLSLILLFGGYQYWKNYTVKDLLERAWEEYISGQHNDAYNLYTEASEYGSAEALFHLARFHRGQLGVERDYEKSKELAEKAINNGYDLGNYLLGVAYQYGEGVAKDSVLARSYYTKSFDHLTELVNKASPLEMYWMGFLYEQGWVVEKDQTKAIELWEKAANKNHPNSMAILGNKYYYGNGLEKNIEIAKEWLDKAAEKKSYYAMTMLGIYYEGLEKPDYNKAYEYYKRASDNGNIDAQYNLAIMYLQGKGVSKNKPEAIVWFKKAANDGHTESMSQLGYLYSEEKNFENAKFWLNRASEKGNASSMTNLGYLFETEFDNVDSANYWYEKAANYQNPWAMNNLGWNYYNGNGYEKDYEKAHDWFLKAANGNSTNSQYGLGLIYYNGNGKEKNWKEAIKWFELAANQDHSKSCANLGDIFVSNKNGISQNYTTALKYYRKGAELGSSWSMYKLGIFYYSGIGGLEKSKSSASFWLKKACNIGEAEACNAIKTYL